MIGSKDEGQEQTNKVNFIAGNAKGGMPRVVRKELDELNEKIENVDVDIPVTDLSGLTTDESLADTLSSYSLTSHNHNTSYVAKSGDTMSGHLTINNDNPTIYFRDKNHRSAMIHVNSNRFYILRGSGNNSTSWSQHNGTWPLEFNLENNDAIFGGDIYMRSRHANRPCIYRVGGIYFTWDSDTYGKNSHHCIRSTDGDSWSDDITINSFGNVRINIDTNANGGNVFTIGRQTTGTGNYLMHVNESGELTMYGGRIATTKNGEGNYQNASLDLGAGNGNGVMATFHPDGYAPMITVGRGEHFYVRNYLNSAYVIWDAILIDRSSGHDKHNVVTLGEIPKSAGAAANPLQAFNGMETVRKMRPVSYQWHEQNALPRMPLNEDGTPNGRRINALTRLNKLRKEQGRGEFTADYLKHQCGRDCENTPEDPCVKVLNYRNGEVGFIAQEIGELVPGAAHLSEERGEAEGIRPLALVAVLTKALQEVDERLQALEKDKRPMPTRSD